VCGQGITNFLTNEEKFLGTFVLLLVVFAVTDERNRTPAGLVPLIVFITFLGVGISLGMQTGTLLLPFTPSLLTESSL
jgi:glycerol uptake facilitator-like aquaporin